jgi:hypothetical protein
VGLGHGEFSVRCFVLAPILKTHVTAADVSYTEAIGIIVQLEEQGLDEREVLSRREQMAKLGHVFHNEQLRSETNLFP